MKKMSDRDRINPENIYEFWDNLDEINSFQK